MTIVSMTGFAESTGSHEGLRWRWETKSVNGRSLELRLRTPPGFESLEQPARMLAAERFRRGNFQISLAVEMDGGARGLKVDPVALAGAVKLAREVAAETGLAPARIDGLLALKGVIVQEEPAIADPVARGHRDAAILKSLATAFDALGKARFGEGAKLAQLLASQMDEIARLISEADNMAAAQPEALRQRLSAQLQELMGSAQVAPERLAQEVALLATRADVREEMDRLRAHVQDARALLGSGQAVGRKLDFLAQEFNREANTLCSKSADIALTRVGLALKAMIDQFREQAQNVE
ncbi:MAG TPA: YicC/YloC family endoribonuclease [Rhizomicrobium sp.]|nr:YicC/YloC family endoribonuclease [Rhizomicrobium sp.]